MRENKSERERNEIEKSRKMLKDNKRKDTRWV